MRAEKSGGILSGAQSRFKKKNCVHHRTGQSRGADTSRQLLKAGALWRTELDLLEE